MAFKNGENSFSTISEDFKEQNIKYVLSKFEGDLYCEEDDIVLPVIRVKHISLPSKGDRWKILENNKVMFLIEGSKLGKKEKEFLKTIDGVNFIIGQYKAGIGSFHGMHMQIKNKLKEMKNLTSKKK